MATVLWVLGVWSLVSLPAGLLIGSVCSLNRRAGEERWVADVRVV